LQGSRSAAGAISIQLYQLNGGLFNTYGAITSKMVTYSTHMEMIHKKTHMAMKIRNQERTPRFRWKLLAGKYHEGQ
jgi:hypothetical protein